MDLCTFLISMFHISSMRLKEHLLRISHHLKQKSLSAWPRAGSLLILRPLGILQLRQSWAKVEPCRCVRTSFLSRFSYRCEIEAAESRSIPMEDKEFSGNKLKMLSESVSEKASVEARPCVSRSHCSSFVSHLCFNVLPEIDHVSLLDYFKSSGFLHIL